MVDDGGVMKRICTFLMVMMILVSAAVPVQAKADDTVYNEASSYVGWREALVAAGVSEDADFPTIV